MSKGQQVIRDWFEYKKWQQFPFQREMEDAYLSGCSGLLNAPTGSGKTFALFLPFLAGYINKYPETYQTRENNGLLMLWITPLRALTNDIRKAMQEVCDDLDIPWKIATRTGDTPAAEKQALKKKLPEVLLTTPESLHLMLAQKDYPRLFQSMEVVVIDEWHELLGTKRGVQVELGLSKLRALRKGGLSNGDLSLALSKGQGTENKDSSTVNGDLSIALSNGDGSEKDKPEYYTTDATSWKALIDQAREMRHKPTEAENILWQQLRAKKLGCKFRRQQPVLDYIPDFVCIEKKLIIEVDGGYHQGADQADYDKGREKYLEEHGYTLLRFGNDAVLNDIEGVIAHIRKSLSNSLPFGEGRGGVELKIEDGRSGVQSSLPASRNSLSSLRIWGISATIGNLEQASEVLLGNNFPQDKIKMVRAHLDKKIVIKSVIPENVEQYSWTGHIGLKLLPEVMQIVAKSNTTLIFTNTRAQSEIWYHAILDNYPEYAGIIAMHHGSLDNDLRNWVEQALHSQALKLVVCTSSLDLGVDFRPVDTVIQVGSPKGVARFMQRAGRSGHHPGATSRIWFIPTHSMELLEGAALKQAMINGNFESRDPILLAMDVLIQYMVTLAVSDGFRADELFNEIKSTYAFADLRRDEFGQLLDFITTGGNTLSQYDEFLKVEVENGLYKVNSRKVAMRHRLSIGTITSEVSLRVKLMHGGSLGNIEEYFISKLKPGDVFWFAGRSLEFIKVKDMTAFVKKSNATKGMIPSWLGGRMPLSSQLAAVFRDKLDEVARGLERDEEVIALKPLFNLQSQLSHLPESHEFLIESFRSRDGHHLLFYPFEGRLVHEGMASLFAYRLSKLKKATFSIAMNDYGFELLTDDDVLLKEALENDLFSIHQLLDDIQHSLNANEMARRRFRDIAHIGGLIFTGYPGQPMKHRHLQASTSLLFDVFSEYEPDNLLVRQAYNEALAFQLEEFRLRQALQRIGKQQVIIKEIERPTPFAFPIMVDSLREKLTTESLEDRVAKMARDYDVDVKTKKTVDEAKPAEPRRKSFFTNGAWGKKKR
ncbi:ligase-associated DNA damage response DEXH box helicase [Mucilaginibacter sp. RS28]|uniref:Ligase-associated DNA damage response DEXH box helicase n=1 Tax=Mucilaginibacter straminoryzae TaxID=2932774 RepID=A0A9X1X6J2_9SPHI|nr:ligase-associated DNA damage response DEXH box helicase [Mucilaginibacter straminoryzae]MCJ8210583.1 ligase-associated DNA damage response DEXH box helicase [Mucilaginibacter straminoryzae]